jgi:hypothetical protein
VVVAAHGVAQDVLDIVAVEERSALLIAEPRDNVAWSTGPHGLKLQLTSSITMTAEMTGTAVVKNAIGEVLPDPPYIPPQHHFAYRYFRYSQAADNVLDGYRNMFLALESLLDYIDAKRADEAETEWLKLLQSLAPATGLLVSVTECPTIEQVMAAEEGADNLPEGGFFPVTFTGKNGAATDEWLFVSEIKPRDLPFSKVASLRLVRTRAGRLNKAVLPKNRGRCPKTRPTRRHHGNGFVP